MRIANIMILYICLSYFNEALHQDRNSFNTSSDTAILLMGALTAGSVKIAELVLSGK